MDDVTTTPAHAKPKDHLWVLAVIAVAVLAEVWASWVGIGAMSGFPRIEHVPTDWVLAVAVEAYWGYALYAWLAAAPGPRSRGMAMWSCGVVFVLSLVSQVSYHELTAPPGASAGKSFVIGFASALPVIILALIAVLIHLRHQDRADAHAAGEAARKAEREAAEAAAAADGRAALRTELEAAHAALKPLRDDLKTAQRDLAEALARAESLTQKLAALSAQKKRAKASGSARGQSGESDPTNELRAVMELRANPKLMQPRMSGELARALGLSAATGRRLHGKLVADGALTQYAQSLIEPLNERSADQSGERS